MENERLFMGIYLGVYGVRTIVLDLKGNARANAEASYIAVKGRAAGTAASCWGAVKETIAKCVELVGDRRKITALAVCGQAGDVVAVNAEKHAIEPGDKLNEELAYKEANRIRLESGVSESRFGDRFLDAYALPKLMWINKRADVYKFISRSDYIAGKLTGRFDVTDSMSAMKLGFDCKNNAWESSLEKLGIKNDKLPEVLAPGTAIERVSKQAATATGLSIRTVVVTGTTDGCACLKATGAYVPSQWATGVGSMLAVYGIETHSPAERANGIQIKRNTDGAFELLAESNAGVRFIDAMFDRDSINACAKRLADITPTGCACYPLAGKGECFPIEDGQLGGFFVGEVATDETFCAAAFEGIGLLERICLEHFAKLKCTIRDEILSASSAPFMDKTAIKLRASIIGKSIRIPKYPTPEAGMAVSAAGAFFHSYKEAAAIMIKDGETIDPDMSLHNRYNEPYSKLKGIILRPDVRCYFYNK